VPLPDPGGPKSIRFSIRFLFQICANIQVSICFVFRTRGSRAKQIKSSSILEF
jgi:hypothetical protein